MIVNSILLHLIQNSTLSCRKGDFIRLTADVVKDSLHLRVIDTGPGLPESIRDHLFQRGSTTRAMGTGFGLYFSKIRAKDLGGDLVWNKDYTPGTAFTLVLPEIKS